MDFREGIWSLVSLLDRPKNGLSNLCRNWSGRIDEVARVLERFGWVQDLLCRRRLGTCLVMSYLRHINYAR
jgi:hypothetical protein